MNKEVEDYLRVQRKVSGLELLDAEEGIFYWLEESNSVNSIKQVFSVLYCVVKFALNYRLYP